jgi:hypothetical protein
MKNGKLLGTGFGGQRAGLPGGEMIFFGGNIFVNFQKGGLDKEVI